MPVPMVTLLRKPKEMRIFGSFVWTRTGTNCGTNDTVEAAKIGLTTLR